MKPILLTLLLAHGADLGSTLYALNNGAHEALIPTQSRLGITAVIAGEAGIETYGLLKLAQKHPKLATVLGWSIVGLRGSIALRNVRVIRQAQ